MRQFRKLVFQSGDDIATHGDMNIRVGFFNQCGKCDPRHKLNRGAYRDAYYFRFFFFDGS